MEGYVKSNTQDGLTTIEFFHPSHNSLPIAQLIQLKEALEVASVDDACKVILLQSGGEKTFCAGASLKEVSELDSLEESKEFFMGFARIINAMRTNNKVIVGRIQGKAIGGGVGLAAACDYTIANQYGSIRLSELVNGLGPFVIGPAVERKIGLSSFSQLTLNPEEWQTAAWAKTKGLYHESFDTTEQMDEYINHYTSKLLTYSKEALKEIKKMLWQGTDHWEDLLEERAAISGELVLGDYAKNAIRKFLER